MVSLGGCGLFVKKYNVSYDNKSDYKNAKDSYRAGIRVRLTYAITATDTDYTFTVTGTDGEPILLEPSEFGEIVFVMPEQDVTVETTSRNSMLNDR